MEQLPHMQQLLRQLQQIPYLASKNLYRVSHYFLELDEHRFEHFIATLREAHQHTVKCELCWAWKERDQQCAWCSSPKREKSIICVVETWHDLCALERTDSFSGVYHVLGGAICPLDGKGPEDLTIDALEERVARLCSVDDGSCSEIILAMNQTPEGEATASFIARKLDQYKHRIKITCLSRGIPVGSSLEVMDRLTIFKALIERRTF